jgi:parallel beta-helix repeat protein
MWVAASENVRVIDNEMHGSVIGLEITVSNNVEVKENRIYDNTLGVGLFHPDAAGNLPLPVMTNWVIEQNHIYANNRENLAPDGSFQKRLLPGVGVLLLGVSGNLIAKNTVEDNDFVGIGVLGWCTSLGGCTPPAPSADPAANNNLVSQNTVIGNGGNPPEGPFDFLAADIVYFEFEGSSGNCFEKNKPGGFTFISSEGTLPTDGC